MKQLHSNQGEMMPPDSSFRCMPQYARRILCLFPEYAWSFATFNYAFQLMGQVKAFMPPQGILLVAAMVPAGWEVRFIDENVRAFDAPFPCCPGWFGMPDSDPITVPSFGPCSGPSYAEVRSRTSSRSPWSPTILSATPETASPAARTHPTTPKEFEHRLLLAMKSPVETRSPQNLSTIRPWISQSNSFEN
jgi:hypothetical protein